MNTTELEVGADRAMSYSHLIIDLFKKLDVDPAEALTATIITSAIIARGGGVSREVIDGVVKDTFDDVYAVPVPGATAN